MSSARAEAQAAIDAAALAAAAAYGAGKANYADVANQSFNQNISRSEGLADVDFAADVKVDKAGNTLTMTVSGNLPTTLTPIGGLMRWPLASPAQTAAAAVSATVSLPVFSDHHKGQIVLAMDYSGSMAQPVGGIQKYKTMRDERAIWSRRCRRTTPTKTWSSASFRFPMRFGSPCLDKFYHGYTGTKEVTDCIDDRNYPSNLTADTPDTSTKDSTSKFYVRGCGTIIPIVS